MASDGRKSLMIDMGAHAHIMQLADTFGVSQPEIVEALLKCVDKARLQAALVDIANQRRLTVEEQKKKRALLEGALKNMTAADLEKLLSNIG